MLRDGFQDRSGYIMLPIHSFYSRNHFFSTQKFGDKGFDVVVSCDCPLLLLFNFSLIYYNLVYIWRWLSKTGADTLNFLSTPSIEETILTDFNTHVRVFFSVCVCMKYKDVFIILDKTWCLSLLFIFLLKTHK